MSNISTVSEHFPPPLRPMLSRAPGVALIAGLSGVLASRWMSETDEAVAAWFHAQRTPGLTAAMQIATAFGSTLWVAGLTLVAALRLAWKRRWYGLLALALAVPGGMALNVILKAAFHRPRPEVELWSQVISGYGFPSGHTMAATLLYGALAVLACGSLDHRRARISAVMGASSLIGLVGWSRLQLGAHYMSDVLGAMAAGVAWLGLCFTTVGILRRSRLRPPRPAC